MSNIAVDLGTLKQLSNPVLAIVKPAIVHPSQVIARSGTSEAACYDILGILGEGGSGIAYRALATQTQQLVALKALSLRQSNDWKAIELFEREAKVLSTLDRDGIPKYLDYFTIDLEGECYFYIAQELAPGKTLLEWMRSGWRASEAEVQDIAIQILEILIYLHRHHPPIVHRDLKPSNILRTDEGKIFLVDFGAIQQTYHDTFMRGSTVVGTYGYMAPEQFRGQAVPATDLYGLGATILHLLTHRSPAEIPQDGLRLNFRDRLQVSSSFADWLERMLEPDVGSRFSSSTKALEVLKTPPKATFKPTLSKLDRLVIGSIGLTILVLIFGVFERYKYYLLGMGGLISKEPFQAMQEQPSVSRIRSYLDRGFNVNTQDANGHTLIYHAMNNDLPEILQMLIERGADVSDLANLSDLDKEELKNLRGRYRDENKRLERTGIGYAGQLREENKRQLQIAERALSQKYVNPIAYYAVIKNKPTILKLVSERGIDLSRSNIGNNNLSFLHLASIDRDGKIVKLLLDLGLDPNIKDRLGCTPLHAAVVREIVSPRTIPTSARSINYLLVAGASTKVNCNFLRYTYPFDREAFDDIFDESIVSRIRSYNDIYASRVSLHQLTYVMKRSDLYTLLADPKFDK
ncbi:protein kinase domain-containing protein [Chamaesiphon polymorphus]|uniref:non-specific serine/threonine protein kinase n=1 Tax=Chamaesiphon polymorphus CCALA 037 TaxID=2107692 RepID=A0A2T1GMG9_9CYAN|nr:protein kinase [Chamaesiphon polymorphus]PSB59095.1 ankryin [Chamaesiphon polymorphus CCALA 037]